MTNFSISSNARSKGKFGAGGRIRTRDLLITNQLLYQLSYASIHFNLERETGLEPATYSLEGCRSSH